MNSLRSPSASVGSFLAPYDNPIIFSHQLPAYLQMAEKGVKAPSPKELRMMAALQRLMGGEE